MLLGEGWGSSELVRDGGRQNCERLRLWQKPIREATSWQHTPTVIPAFIAGIQGAAVAEASFVATCSHQTPMPRLAES